VHQRVLVDAHAQLEQVRVAGRAEGHMGRRRRRVVVDHQREPAHRPVAPEGDRHRHQGRVERARRRLERDETGGILDRAVAEHRLAQVVPARGPLRVLVRGTGRGARSDRADERERQESCPHPRSSREQAWPHSHSSSL
jgi:hypothetical protein